MDTLMFKVLELVITIVLILLMRYLVPLLSKAASNAQYQWLANLVMDAVKAAEQTMSGGCVKKDAVVQYVTSVLQQRGIVIEAAQLDYLIESAVYTIKQEKLNGSNSRTEEKIR